MIFATEFVSAVAGGGAIYFVKVALKEVVNLDVHLLHVKDL